MTTFQEGIKRFFPGYMLRRWSSTLIEAVGAHLDEQAQRAFDGQCAAIPYSGGAKTRGNVKLECASDVLPWHAGDRGIKLYTTEPEASRRLRLSRWRELKRRRGSHRGEMEHVQPYFLGEDGLGVLPRIRIVHRSNEDTPRATWHTLSGSYDPGGAGIYSVYRKSPSNWDFHTFFERWSEWWAIVYTPGSVLAPGTTYWNDGHLWNGGQIWGGVPLAVLEDLIAMFIDWQAAHSRCCGIILAHDLSLFDPTADPALVGDGRTTLPSAVWLGIPWSYLVNPATNLPTRPQNATWIFDVYNQGA